MTRSWFTFTPALAAAATIAVGLAAPSVIAQESATPAEEAVYLDEPTAAPEPAEVGQGPVKEEYEPGKVRVERIVKKLSDDTFVNHGKYIEYYRNGQKFAEGDYENGVHEGPWSYWHENGQLSKTLTFSKGQPNGQWEVSRADGTLLARRGYKNGKRDGDWVLYQEDGKTPSIEQTYVDGKLNGKVTVYFKSGKPRIETFFKDNLREGKVTEWDESGRKVGEAEYAGGKLNGKLIRYAPDGTTVEEVYQDNKRVQSGG
jgi:antitoxin component YwqK of YwqJK toxin-antitoxin module